MPKRQTVAATVRFGSRTIGILAPLPTSLSRDKLREALQGEQADPASFETWLGARLREVTGGEYRVASDLGSWERDPASTLIYEAVRITEPLA